VYSYWIFADNAKLVQLLINKLQEEEGEDIGIQFEYRFKDYIKS